MRLTGLGIGVLIVVAGAIGVVAPDVLVSAGRSIITPRGLYAITALRIAIGLVFVLEARASRAPRTLRVLGVPRRFQVRLKPDTTGAAFREREHLWSANFAGSALIVVIFFVRSWWASCFRGCVNAAPPAAAARR
jgi:hypothetical protein